ncbi:MAG: Stk1 family PASTA domain-containing Ser/Thr kinase [Oscillospiraceae bacterium]|nr:Stk1 family PASTA domain-containing Ser/Thr kinase [Oscillospiraceae bacterium]
MDSNIGKKLDGRYELLELIGVGGMADIYRARDIEEDRIVAVKILKTEFAGSDEFLRRFRNESKAIALLSHPNIVKIYDVGFTEKVQFIVMEYVDGITLTDYIEQQGVLKWRDSIHFTVQILKALQHAHDRGIVHRDVKSQNVMLLSDGTIKVMDFGIARFNRENNKTMSEKTIGSVHYISPEQARGDITDERSDIYSVGVALYEMVTGKKPFDGDTPVSIALMHMQSTPKKPTELNSTIPEGLEQIILRAMQKDPNHRYQTAGEMIKDLEELKKNPALIFEYKYNSTDGTTKYFDRPMQAGEPEKPRRKQMIVTIPDDDYDDDYDDDDDEYEERRSPLIPILFAVGTAFIIAAVFLVLMLINRYFGENSSLPTSGANPGGSSDTSISVTAGEEMEMPNMIGMTWEQAYSKYASYLNLVAQQEWSEYEKDQIFDQELPEGRKVKVGTTITVKVSKGIKQVEVQDLTNRTVDAAERQLKKDGFKVKKTYEESDDIAANCVIRTEPPAHEQAPQGSTVTLVISLGATETLMSVPKLTDMPIETALERCEEYYLVPEIEYVDTDEFEKGMVISQSIEPNEHVERNTEIILEVSTGEIAEKTKKFSFAIPNSAEGEFEFLYYIDGMRDTERGEEIRDVSLASNKTIPYELTGKVGDEKELVIKVTSTKTGASGTYLVVKFTFGENAVTYEIVETNKKIFKELLSAEGDEPVEDDRSDEAVETEDVPAETAEPTEEPAPEDEPQPEDTEPDAPAQGDSGIPVA